MWAVDTGSVGNLELAPSKLFLTGMYGGLGKGRGKGWSFGKRKGKRGGRGWRVTYMFVL